MPASSHHTSIRLMGLCGSLRAASVNLALLRAAQTLLPKEMSLSVFEGLETIPPFNPDREDRPDEPSAVLHFRVQLREADGVLIASPEYAHGIPGAFKNALDWIVGSGELSGKPVAVLNASPLSTHAWAALQEIIRTMDARLVPEACLRIPLPTNKMTPADILALPVARRLLATAVSALALSAKPTQSQPPK